MEEKVPRSWAVNCYQEKAENTALPQMGKEAEQKPRQRQGKEAENFSGLSPSTSHGINARL